MKALINISLLLVFLLTGCTNSTKIYIIRHAEKSTEPAENPHLTSDGNKRAEALKDLLKDKDVGYIFSTNTTRTMETATPLSNSIHIPIQLYNNDTLSQFLNMLVSLKKNTLIVGHSNNILPMLDQLHLSHSVTSIPDNEYSHLFIITVKNGKAESLEESSYNY